jgi:thiamine-monophosphate kinase
VLGPGKEFDLIRSIWTRLGGRLTSEAGDDCAFVSLGGTPVAITSDIAVEGTHFRLGWLTHYEVGWRAAAGALSDLAAVAAIPAGVMVSVGSPEEWPDAFVVELMDGVGDAAGAVGAKVWGGDLVRSEKCVVDVVCVGMGERESGRAGGFVRRSGAEAGDTLWVTGRLGGPKVALDALYAGREPEASARERLVHPMPRIQEALWLHEHGAKAMIDISDGLADDAGHLAAASGVKLVIDADAVPAHRSVPPALPSSRSPVLISGEEYEILVALPSTFDAHQAFESRFAIPLTRIGTVDRGAGVTLTRAGEPMPLPQGYRHFS